MKLTIYLHKDRTLPGVLVFGGTASQTAVVPQAFPCLGKSDNKAAAKAGNPDRNPLEPYGDLPLGTYKGRVVQFGRDLTEKQRLRKFGPHPALYLEPVSGPCKDANRPGIGLHGGEMGPDKRLRPTLGCARTTDDAMGALVAAIGGQTIDVEVIEVA